MPEPRPFWEDLFGARADQAGEERVQMQVVNKHKRPFLLLPCQPHAAAVSLSLYPAQTRRARLARALLRCLVSARIPFGTRRISFTVSSGARFADRKSVV